MKLKLCVCLLLGGLAFATQALATPQNTSRIFLSVDIDGVRNLPDAIGPTQAGFQGWTIYGTPDPFNGAYDPTVDWGVNGGPPTGLSKVFATSQGNITAHLIGVPANS